MSPEFDPLNPYGVSRDNTNISDLTPHIAGTPHRNVGFEPAATKEVEDPAAGISTPVWETKNGGGNGSPKGGNSTTSTYAPSNSDGGSEDDGHASTMEDTIIRVEVAQNNSRSERLSEQVD